MAPRKKGDGKKGGAASPPKPTIEGLSDDQRYSLVEQHRQKYERLIAAQKAANKAVQDHGKIIKADLGESGMAEIKSLIEAGSVEGVEAIKARIERDLRILRWSNEPVGTIHDLFPETDRRPIGERSYEAGKRQGLAGESCSNPHHPSTEAFREHERGYADGQSTLATKGFSKLETDKNPGALPREQWQQQTADENRRVEEAIKSGNVHTLGTQPASHQVQA